jgi:hypothetical protein
VKQTGNGNAANKSKPLTPRPVRLGFVYATRIRLSHRRRPPFRELKKFVPTILQRLQTFEIYLFALDAGFGSIGIDIQKIPQKRLTIACNPMYFTN